MGKQVFLLLGLFFIWACSTDSENEDEMETEEIGNTDDGQIEVPEDDPVPTLSETDLDFLEEYHYVTFNLSPTSFGGDRNEKWQAQAKLFLDGNVDESYATAIARELDTLNSFMTDGASLQLVNTLEEADIHLYMAPVDSIQTLWPDIYEPARNGGFWGYALYNGDGSYGITGGRIWVRDGDIPLFRHELGHILGMGHASDPFCTDDSGDRRSFMCSFLANEYSSFDRNIIKTLYHPDVEIGKSFGELRPIIEELLLSGDIDL